MTLRVDEKAFKKEVMDSVKKEVMDSVTRAVIELMHEIGEIQSNNLNKEVNKNLIDLMNKKHKEHIKVINKILKLHLKVAVVEFNKKINEVIVDSYAKLVSIKNKVDKK